MSDDPAYRNYWRRKQLMAGPLPAFPVRRWWASTSLSDIERAYFDAIAAAPSLLDVGAGDLRVMRKFREAGYRGEYHTQDIGGEYPHDYASLDDVRRTYDAILCLDVIEHMPLRDGLTMIDRMADLLGPGGTLIIQTPNARCVRYPLSTDMTHLHCYNVFDLWAYLTGAGLEAQGYRINFGPPTRSPVVALRSLVSRFVITRVLESDYADNIAVIARKPASPPAPSP